MSLQLPTIFKKRMEKTLGSDFDAFEIALNSAPPTSIRLNIIKETSLDLTLAEQIPWCPNAYYLPERPVFTIDPLLHAGAYYVQEASSMVIATALKGKKFNRILDLCAAPGGKSTLLSSFLTDDGLLIAAEPVPQRAHILAENILKWGDERTMVLQARPENMSAYFVDCFDLIVVDAPCSGEGLFRKNPESTEEWNAESPQNCAIRQADILHEAIKMLAPNGILLYSTCTFAEIENDEQITNLLKKNSYLEPWAWEIPSEWGFSPKLFYDQKAYAYQAYPHKVKGEGFFIATITKIEESLKTPMPKLPKKATPTVIMLKEDVPKQAISWLPDCNKKDWVKIEDEWFYWPFKHTWLQAAMLSGLVLTAGLPLAQTKGSDWIPHPGLALNRHYQQRPFLQLSKPEMLQFLRKESIETPNKTAWQLVGFQNLAIGWLKLIGTRSNNYWPKHWRIRNL